MIDVFVVQCEVHSVKRVVRLTTTLLNIIHRSSLYVGYHHIIAIDRHCPLDSWRRWEEGGGGRRREERAKKGEKRGKSKRRRSCCLLLFRQARVGARQGPGSGKLSTVSDDWNSCELFHLIH
eukprot:scaffold1483_cov153-Skeletonema_menzelii.AAC.14